MNGYQTMEVLGLAILLVATLWQLFFISIVNEMVHQVRLKRVNDKLDLLWEYLGKYTANQIDKSCSFAGEPKYNKIKQKWYKADEQSLEKHPLMGFTSRQEKIRVALFILGSILLIASKTWGYSVT